jgi:hypothetical protein
VTVHPAARSASARREATVFVRLEAAPVPPMAGVTVAQTASVLWGAGLVSVEKVILCYRLSYLCIMKLVKISHVLCIVYNLFISNSTA